VLRSELGPGAMVGGPSVYGWRSDWIEGLLEYCRTKGCQVNLLSWHELSNGSIPAIEDRLEWARKNLLESSRYRAVRIRELHVNEATTAADQYRPGSVLGVMHYLEAGRADAAARTCWDDLGGKSNCYNDNLAGLLELASSRSDEPGSAQLLIAHMRGHSRREVDVKITFRKLRKLGFLRGERGCASRSSASRTLASSPSPSRAAGGPRWCR
jgi:hypothetical protein